MEENKKNCFFEYVRPLSANSGKKYMYSLLNACPLSLFDTFTPSLDSLTIKNWTNKLLNSVTLLLVYWTCSDSLHIRSLSRDLIFTVESRKER